MPFYPDGLRSICQNIIIKIVISIIFYKVQYKLALQAIINTYFII